MQIQQIQVEGFGTLSRCRVSPIGSGLTVLYGNNGAGKTTLLEFVRGVLCGFDHARSLRLLPPLREGTPGGSLTIQHGNVLFDVIRHARADGSDTLAITSQQATPNEVSGLRQALKNLSEQTVRTEFMVSGYDAHCLQSLVNLARNQGIELASRRTSANWLTVRIQSLQDERSALHQVGGPFGELARLDQRRRQLATAIEEARLAQQQRIASWQHALQALRLKIERLHQEADWLVRELHACESDLTEVQTRLWSTQESTIVEHEEVVQKVVQSPADWKRQIAAIDREIANAQQVLRDLAGSRMSLSISQSELVGSEVPDIDVTFERQRASLAKMEAQTTLLSLLAARLSSSTECACGPRASALEDSVQEIRSHIWLLCQEISRQQSSQQQWLLQTQREGVDGCELELTQQIRRLRLRRDELLQRHASLAAEQVAYRASHESAYCRCEGHDQAATIQHDVELVSVPQLVTRTRQVVTSAARPGDAALERELLERCRQLRQQWLDAVAHIRRSEADLEKLRIVTPELSQDRTVQTLVNELQAVEQSLTAGQERWRTLKLAETALERTQQKLNVEIPSQVIEEASALLLRMTYGRYTGFRYEPETNELKIISSTGGDLAAAALSRGTLEQSALCFRLALARQFHRIGCTLPLVLDDILVDSDENRSRAAVDVLVDCARSQQIIFLTCQEHLLDLFESYNVSILELPGSVRPSRQLAIENFTPLVQSTLPPLSDKSASKVSTVVAARSVTVPVEKDETEKHEAGEMPVFDRVQPDRPYWLDPSSPLSQVPSLGSQMARRLGTIGVRDVGDLVDLDPEVLEIPLDSLQISAATLRQWQAEARLLCCIPNLTGRDAQLLVRCGILTPVELAQADARTLLTLVRRVRGEATGSQSLPWLSQQSDWPTQDDISSWTRFARGARSWRKLRDAHTPARRLQRQDLRDRSAIRPVAQLPQVRLMNESVTTEDREWRFYLEFNSPIVDAPSIGPRTADRLNAIGIHLVSDLLEQSPKECAMVLGRREITAETILSWQQQAILMCRVPQLRGHDAQVLVACDVTEPTELAQMDAASLFARIEPFVNSKEGQRLLRSSKTPDLEEVTEWIDCARQSPMLKAA